MEHVTQSLTHLAVPERALDLGVGAHRDQAEIGELENGSPENLVSLLNRLTAVVANHGDGGGGGVGELGSKIRLRDISKTVLHPIVGVLGVRAYEPR